MAVDYAPTGREIVSGSYDRSIRIFGESEGTSREVYTARRLQRVFAVKFSADNRFVLSGSEDANIRIWKANASQNLNTVGCFEHTYYYHHRILLSHLSMYGCSSNYCLLFYVVGASRGKENQLSEQTQGSISKHERY